MKLRCIELKQKNSNKYKYLFEIFDETKSILKNLKYINKINDTRCYFEMQYTLFDNLTEKGICYLNNLYQKFGNGHKFTKNNWKSYIYKSCYDIIDDEEILKDNIEIPIYKIGKIASRTTNYYDILEYDYISEKINKKPGVKPQNEIKSIESEEELKILSNYIKDKYNNINLTNDFDELTIYEANFKNETEIFHAFLTIIFNLSIDFKIRKCKICNKYFITRNFSTTENCNRLYKDNLTCIKFNEKTNHIKNGRTDIKKLEDRLRSLYKSRGDLLYESEEYFDFCNELREKKNTLSNKEYIIWLLNNYKKDETIIKAIDEFKFDTSLKEVRNSNY